MRAVRWSILPLLVASGAFGPDATAGKERVPVPATCGDVDVEALLHEQVHQRARKPSAAATKARRVCDKACAGGEQAACLKLGEFHANALGGPKNEQRAVALFKAGCDADDAPSCTRLGFSYEGGQGVPEDHDRSRELGQKACDLGDKEGCRLARAVEKDRSDEEERKRALARMSPVERDGVTCTEPGPWTAPRQATCERACEAGQPRACRALSAVYEGGQGVKADLAKSIAYAQKACKLGDQKGCAAAEALEESRRNGGRDVGILGALRAPPVRSASTGQAGAGGDAGVTAQPARTRP